MARNTLFTDNTIRADNSDLGAVWDPYTGADSGRIHSNLIKPNAVTNLAGQETYNGTIPANDQWASVKIRTINPSVYVNAGVAVRHSAPSTITGYLAAVQFHDIFIGKNIAGVFTLLASASYTVPANPQNIDVSLEVVGTGLEAFIDLVSKVSTTDASIASGRTGVVWYVDTGGTNEDVMLTDFAMGDFSASSNKAGPLSSGPILKSLVGGSLVS